MTNPPSPNEALREARHIYWQYMEDIAAAKGAEMAEGQKEKCLAGDMDDQHGIQIALRALASPSPASSPVAREVMTLVIAARAAWEEMQDLAVSRLNLDNLDRALEAFSSRVPYENEPKGATASSPVGEGDNALLNTARRNIRTFINGASFKCSADKEAALACVDVLESNLSQPTPASARDNQAIWDALRDFTLADGRTLESFFVKGNDKINFCCLIASLSPLSGEPASVAVEAVEKLKLVNSWLCTVAQLNMDEIVADGGITAAMVVGKEADLQQKRLRSAIADLLAAPAGWQLVPVEITDAMLSATCCDEGDDREMRQTWKELLYAAPKPPVSLSKPTPVEAGLREELEQTISAHRRLVQSVLDAIDTGRSEPLFIVRDQLRNYLAALSETPPPPSQEGGDGHD